MKGNTFLYALIGTPQGFEFKISGNDTDGLMEAIKVGNELDLDNSRIRATPDGEIWCLKKKNVNGKTYYFYILYRYALEIGGTRTGAFYGSAIVANGKIGLDYISEALKDLTNLIKDNAMRGDSFEKNISTIDLTSKTPKSVIAVYERMQPTSYKELTQNEIFIKTTDSNVIEEYPKAKSIYISGSQEVEAIVKNKKLLKIITIPSNVPAPTEVKTITISELEYNRLKSQSENVGKPDLFHLQELGKKEQENEELKSEIAKMKTVSKPPSEVIIPKKSWGFWVKRTVSNPIFYIPSVIVVAVFFLWSIDIIGIIFPKNDNKNIAKTEMDKKADRKVTEDKQQQKKEDDAINKQLAEEEAKKAKEDEKKKQEEAKKAKEDEQKKQDEAKKGKEKEHKKQEEANKIKEQEKKKQEDADKKVKEDADKKEEDTKKIEDVEIEFIFGNHDTLKAGLSKIFTDEGVKYILERKIGLYTTGKNAKQVDVNTGFGVEATDNLKVTIPKNMIRNPKKTKYP